MEWYDDVSLPDEDSLNIGSGTANVITGLEDTLASVDIDNLSDILTGAEDYWSLTSLAGPTPIGGPPFENILEQFATYAPLWTLACLTPDQYNNPYLYRGNPAALEHIIFSSAGRFDGQRTQTIVGAPEYFVNNFSIDMTTTAGKKTGNTNMINMSFEVYEPYSMAYFIQSLQTSAINAGYPNYNGTPYLLMLEFAGHKDNGQMFASSEKLKKYFTIQIKKVTFTTTEGGTVYKVEAAPYNHTGFTNIAQQLTTDVKLRGDTVKEMLISGDVSLCNMLNRQQIDLFKKGKQETVDEYVVVFPKNWADQIGLPGKGDTPDDALNAAADPDEPITSPITGRRGQKVLEFGLGEIGAADLGFGASSGGNYAFGFENDVTDEKTGLIQRGQVRIDPKQREFQFKEGTTIQNIIQDVVLSSEYGKNAINPAKIDAATGRLKWFRVDVQVEIGAFDLKRNCRSRRYIFRVMPFMVHSSVFRSPSANPAGYGGLNKICGKEYKYIYTGQNNDIIKFDIQINQLFNSGMNPTPLENSDSVSNPGSQQSSEESDRKESTSDTNEAANTTTIDSSPAFRTKETTDRSTKGGYGAQTVAQRVADMLKNKILTQGSTGDMTKVNLEIIGDPYWMTDSGMGNYISDIYDGPRGGEASMTDADGSLNYQGADTYIRIMFRTPVEPNLGIVGQGGLYNFPPNEPENPYSGLYKVIRCTSKFQDGKFTQNLECTRMPNQPQDIEGYKGPSKDSFMSDISKSDTPKSSPNDDAIDSIEQDPFYGFDLSGAGPGPSDEEIAQNNADLGDFEG
jgi:hypothetical protein